MLVPRRFLLPTIVLCALTASCGADPQPVAGGPEEGLWDGQDLTFFLQGGALSQVTLKAPLTCTGDGGCKGKVSGPVTGSFGSSPLGGSGQTPDGTVTIAGQFTSWTTAAGTVEAQAGTCCKAVAAWSAEWVPGTKPGQVADGGPTTPVKGWGKFSTGTLHPLPPRVQAVQALSAPPEASKSQAKAAEILEILRAQLGIAPCTLAMPLAKAAQAHADFYVAHGAQYDAAKLSPHSENAAFGAGFTGADPGTRATAAGWGNPGVFEVMAFTGSPQGAIAGWMDTVYHRFPLISPTSKDFGYGQGAAGKYHTEVMDLSGGTPEPGGVVVYPWPGQTSIAASWMGNEGPQPPAPAGGFPSGPVISARFSTPVEVTAHTLRGPDGAEIDHVWLDAQGDKNLAMFDSKQKVIYATKPLAAGTHTVRIAAKVNGQAEVVEWTFVVGP